MSNIVGLLYFVEAIMIFVFRGSHSGYVCSGWYLSHAERDNENVRSVYDIDVGMFLFVLMIFNIVTFGCMCFWSLVACCGATSYQMNWRSNQDFNMNMTADQMNQY